MQIGIVDSWARTGLTIRHDTTPCLEINRNPLHETHILSLLFCHMAYATLPNIQSYTDLVQLR